MNRRILVLAVLLLLIVVGLAGFYLYLTGGSSAARTEKPKSTVGLVHVRSIYTADGENLKRPTGLGADDEGNFYVTLKENARVVAFDRNGDFIAKWGKPGIEQGQFLSPLAVAANRLANQVYVIDRARLRIIAFDTKGQFQWERALLNPVGVTMVGENVLATTFGPLVYMDAEGEPIREIGSRGFDLGLFDYPRAAVELEGGDVVVADTNNARVQRVKLSGELTATVVWHRGDPPKGQSGMQDDPTTTYGVPSGITADDDGHVFVLDGFRYKIEALNAADGKVVYTFEGLEGDADGVFYLPTGIVHLGGDRFAITDTYNDRVQIVRLLLPGQNTFVNRNRWVLWLLPLLFLPLLLLLGRKRTFVSRETLDRAREDGNLRLLAAVFGKLRVLPDVASDYAGVSEDDVAISEYLVPVGEEPRADDSAADEPEARLAAAARPTPLGRLLLPRHLVLCADEAQCDRLSDRVRRVRDYASVLDEYQLQGEK